MQLVCPSCTRILVFSGEPPRFCGYCGRSLAVSPLPTVPVDAGVPLAPAADEAKTIAPGTPPPEAAATVGLSTPALGDLGPDVPEAIGGYRLLRRLGGGGMGAVYEAEDAASGRRVALKLILPQYAGAADALVRFRQEGRLASTLAHPRCVFVLAADEEAGRPYIVMELMPGATLADLVGERGPLPPEQAVAKILDVIDGLDEAHRRGLVHRDVKPSNCFLEASGRVKIGDFGLSRSLVSDAKLTRTGAFIGTPLYAAPEQIHKKEATDAQSDVYAVAATLYFLLTGRAPFQSAGDAMATLARIVTEDPPPMRALRPGLPRALDKVVRRGLERDRRRRYPDLAEFRNALLVFLPARPSVSGLGLRYAAYLIDSAVLFVLAMLAGFGIGFIPLPTVEAHLLLGSATGAVVNLVYYGTLEGRWGCALGKRLLRLRVGTTTGAQPPGIWRALVRAATLYVLFHLGNVVSEVLLLQIHLPADGKLAPQQTVQFSLIGLLSGAWLVLAVVLTLSTMRARNGYRGAHEIISGTRTYQLRWPRPQRRQVVRSRPFEPAVTRPDGLPERVGAFRVRGALRWDERERTLLAEDPQLERLVWLWLRPASAPPLDTVQRDVSRGTRVRWVACGTDGPWQWDAFLAPAGMPLPVLAAGQPRLSWADVRPILEDLAEELAAACADGTLPRVLATDQVWVQPDGRVQLLGAPLAGVREGGGTATATTDPQRALSFLREVAVMAMEGAARPIAASGDAVRAPLPGHATEVLDQLFGKGRPLATVEALRQELESERDRPAAVSRRRRAGHLLLMGLLLTVPFGGPVVLVVATYFGLLHAHRAAPEYAAVVLAVNCGFWVLWAFLCRGGYAFWRGGIVLRRADGRKASRLQCALRALLVWTPLATLYAAAMVVATFAPALDGLYFALWGAGSLLLPLYAVLALLDPTRGPHDRIVGTYLVPD